MSLNIGDLAPDFTLLNSELKEVRLFDYKGKNKVLLFFPFAFTSVCTDELCHMRDNYSAYNDLNAEILAISVDSPFTLSKFKEQENLNFEVLSDFNKEVSQDYHAYYDVFVKGLVGVSKRAAFVLDANNKIKYAEVLDNAGNLPNFDKITAALKN